MSEGRKEDQGLPLVSVLDGKSTIGRFTEASGTPEPLRTKLVAFLNARSLATQPGDRTHKAVADWSHPPNPKGIPLRGHIQISVCKSKQECVGAAEANKNSSVRAIDSYQAKWAKWARLNRKPTLLLVYLRKRAAGSSKNTE